MPNYDSGDVTVLMTKPADRQQGGRDMPDSVVLSYGWITAPSQLVAGSPGRVTFEVTNGTSGSVAVEGFVWTVPVGTNARDLAPDAASVTLTPPTDWVPEKSNPTGQVRYVVLPPGKASEIPLCKGASLTFYLDVTANAEQGPIEPIKIVEGTGGCDPQSDCPVECVPLTKAPAAPTVTLEASPGALPKPGPVSLSWTGPASATYTIKWYTPLGGPETHEATGPGSYQVPYLPSTATFTLTVSGKQGSWQAKVTVEGGQQ